MNLARVAALQSPHDRARKAAVLLERENARHEQAEAAILEVRDGACRELLGTDESFAAVGRLIGRTRSLVRQRFPEYASRR